MMEKNENVFFFEVCNISIPQNNVIKNFQTFFVFSNQKEDFYFRLPNFVLKIKNKSDFDNTEVRVNIPYESIFSLINLLENHLRTKENLAIEVSDQKVVLKLRKINNDMSELEINILRNDSSNSIFLGNTFLHSFLYFLKNISENIIKISLDFINLAQIQSVLEDIKEIKTNILNFLRMKNEEKKFYDYSSYPENNIIACESNISEVQYFCQTDKEANIEVNIKENGTEMEMAVISGQNERDIEKEEAQKFYENYISEKNNKTEEERFKEKFLSILEESFNEKKKVFDTLKEVIFEYNVFRKNFLEFENYYKYTYLTKNSFLIFMKKLSLVTELYSVISQSIPLLPFKIRLIDSYIKDTSILNKVLIGLYLEYRDKKDLTEFEKYLLYSLKMVFAPFWISYVVYSPEEMDHNVLKQVRVLGNKILENNQDSIFDSLESLIQKNNLGINHSLNKDKVLDKLLYLECFSLLKCFKDPKDINKENVEMLEKVLSDLGETYVYQDIVFPKELDIEKLHENCLRVIKLFSKENSIRDNMSFEKVLEKYEEVKKQPIENIISEFKALQVLDIYDGKLFVADPLPSDGDIVK